TTSPGLGWLQMQSSCPFSAGSSTAHFTVTPANATTRIDGTATASLIQGVLDASAPFTILPGGDTDLGPCKECEKQGGGPINFTNGNVWVTQQDYSLPGLGGGLSLVRTWNSLWANTGATGSNGPGTAGMFGHSWRSTYEERIMPLASSGSDKKYWRA